MKALFSAAIAIILLGIYVLLVIYAVDASFGDKPTEVFNDRMASSLHLIGGLVSALVIAQLAVTDPGKAPNMKLLGVDVDAISQAVLKWVIGGYMVVWLIAGFTAFFVGYLRLEPGQLPALSDLGQAWLGIAVGAGYAYLGVKPPKDS